MAPRWLQVDSSTPPRSRDPTTVGIMYAGEDGGTFVELGYVGKPLSVAKAMQPDKSKAGGWPAWFGEAPVDVGDLVCRLCGRWLYLVTQIYAPTHVERSLCIFGCNRAACSLRPEGWRVVRTQAQQLAQPTLNVNHLPTPAIDSTADVVPPTPPIPAQAAVGTRAVDAWGASDVSWGAPASDDDGWGAESSEWGAGADTEGVGGTATAVIDALLLEQEKRSSDFRNDRTAAVAGGAATIATGRSNGGLTCGKCTLGELLPNHSGSRGSQKQTCAAVGSEPESLAPAVVVSRDGEGRPCFPPKSVSFMPEPWEAEGHGADDRDMENRLRRYREQEEDRGLIAALDEALRLKDGGGAGSGSQQGGGGGGGVFSIGEKYERTPARAKAVMRFAERVSRFPQQAVRYAYGGQPLWSTSDPPNEELPPCACGSTLVFEMQLMPALLLQLQVNDVANRETDGRQGENININPDPNGESRKSTTPSATASQSNGASSTRPTDGIDSTGVAPADESGKVAGTSGYGDEDDGDLDTSSTMMPTHSAEECQRLKTLGMDWGVVAVWSCPRSCGASCEERVVVQLPV